MQMDGARILNGTTMVAIIILVIFIIISPILIFVIDIIVDYINKFLK